MIVQRKERGPVAWRAAAELALAPEECAGGGRRARSAGWPALRAGSTSPTSDAVLSPEIEYERHRLCAPRTNRQPTKR